MDVFVSVCLGLGLAAASGFRVFVPLLVVALAARAGVVPLDASWAWLESSTALVVFGVAAAVETAAYFVPVVDNLLDTIATPAAVVAGTIVMAAVVTDLDPVVTWSLAIIAGGGTAAAVQGTTVAARAVSTTTTSGVANPVFGGTETAGSVGLAVMAVLLPVVAAVLVVALLVAVGVALPRILRRRRGPHPAPPDRR